MLRIDAKRSLAVIYFTLGKEGIKLEQAVFNMPLPKASMVFQALDKAREAVMITDGNGLILYINASYARIMGCTVEERVGQNFWDGNPKGALARVLQTGIAVANFRHRPKRCRIDVVSDAYPLEEEGKMVGAVVFFQDITQIQELTRELQERKKEAELLSEKLVQLGRAKSTFADLIGQSPAFLDAISVARKAARGDSSVLLRGESGTGKELLAEAIHNAGPRREKPFIAVNCAAIPDELMESELFGYEKGAFTGANQRKLGLFELAHEGTIFLDEIGDMNLTMQAKVLRVLQNGELRRVGAIAKQYVDVRVIAATNRNLEGMLQEGKFRGDLYFRINVVSIRLPPLRERREDLPLLVDYLSRKLSRKLGRSLPELEEAAMRKLLQYQWPGNVRELENVLERALTLSEGYQIASRDIFILPLMEEQQAEVLPLSQVKKVMLERALARYGSTVEGKKKVARELGISLRTLYNILAHEKQVSKN